MTEPRQIIIRNCDIEYLYSDIKKYRVASCEVADVSIDINDRLFRDFRDNVRFIEYSAFAELQEKLKIAEEALDYFKGWGIAENALAKIRGEG